MLVENRFSFGLRDEKQIGKAGVHGSNVAELHLTGNRALDVNRELRAGAPTRHQRIRQTKTCEHFQAARLHGQRTRLVRTIDKAIDDTESNVKHTKLRGQRESSRARAYDEDVERDFTHGPSIVLELILAGWRSTARLRILVVRRRCLASGRSSLPLDSLLG